MYLGLDLRGGVHFMLQVDMQAALTKKAESSPATCAPAAARQERAPRGISRNGQTIEVRLPRPASAAGGQARAAGPVPDLQHHRQPDGTE
jgi:preprotein translocase subunit SecD